MCSGNVLEHVVPPRIFHEFLTVVMAQLLKKSFEFEVESFLVRAQLNFSNLYQKIGVIRFKGTRVSVVRG